jgi:hypothetical protein
MTTPLSPAAQNGGKFIDSKTLDAYIQGLATKRLSRLAAALRALAVRIKGADAVRQDVLDIADELESPP